MSYEKKRAKFNVKSTKNSNESQKTTPNSKYKLYFVPGRIQSKRLETMKACAAKNGFSVAELFSPDVTHLLTEFDNKEQVLRNLEVDFSTDLLNNMRILSTKWFIDSIKQGRPIDPIPSEYKVRSENTDSEIELNNNKNNKTDYSLYNCYACQRRTPLIHHNYKLTDALDILARHAELRDAEGDYVRALAFNKAAAVLKSFPRIIVKSNEAAKLKDIGKHSLKVIKEILEDGFSSEVDQIKNDDWFITMQIFNTVYGVGPVLANQWYSRGFRSIDQIKNLKLEENIQLSGDTEKIHYGLAFHDDLNTPVTITEANNILKFIEQEAEQILPGVKLEIAGGFRRGKQTGHDVDILLTHPVPGKEVGLLKQIHQRLTSMGLILHGYNQKNSFNEGRIQQELKNPSPSSNVNVMDDFEKCFYIFRMPTTSNDFRSVKLVGDPLPARSEFSAICQLAELKRNWRAVRIDLILSPADQYAFCLVGWTGNKNFNRSIRNYAKKILNMRLTSHGLWSYETQKRIPAYSEQEIFAHLKLDIMEPCDRNV